MDQPDSPREQNTVAYFCLPIEGRLSVEQCEWLRDWMAERIELNPTQNLSVDAYGNIVISSLRVPSAAKRLAAVKKLFEAVSSFVGRIPESGISLPQYQPIPTGIKEARRLACELLGKLMPAFAKAGTTDADPLQLKRLAADGTENLSKLRQVIDFLRGQITEAIRNEALGKAKPLLTVRQLRISPGEKSAVVLNGCPGTVSVYPDFVEISVSTDRCSVTTVRICAGDSIEINHGDLNGLNCAFTDGSVEITPRLGGSSIQIPDEDDDRTDGQ